MIARRRRGRNKPAIAPANDSNAARLNAATNPLVKCTAESADPGATARFLRVCTSMGLLTCTDETHFSGTPLLDVLRRDAVGSQWGFAVSMPAPGNWLPWGHLPDVVRSGRSQAENIIGGNLYEYYQQHPEDWQNYHSRYVTPQVFQNSLRSDLPK